MVCCRTYVFELDDDNFAEMPAHPGKQFLLPHVIESLLVPKVREILEDEVRTLQQDIQKLKESAQARAMKSRADIEYVIMSIDFLCDHNMNCYYTEA